MNSVKSTREARIFDVVTRFQELARRPGGVPRELAMAQAASNIHQLKQEFDPWLRRTIAELEAALADLHRDGADPEAAFRAENGCRDLQAVAGPLGFDLISTVASSLGDVVSALRDGAPYDVAAVTCHTDALSLAIKFGPSLPPAQIAELVGGLRKVAELARRLPGAPAPAA